MQAFTAQTLQQLNIATLDDYIKYLPNVTTANNGPGQNEVFMRGLSAGSQPSQGSGSTGLWPNVAIYLDNQSGQLPGPQPRHLCGRPEPHRSAGRPAGHAVRRRRRGGRDPLHHQRAAAGQDRGERQRQLRRDRARGPEYRPHGGAERAADRRHLGGARGDLQRPPRRLHRQRAGDLHAQEHRYRHVLRALPGERAGAMPRRPAQQRLLRAARHGRHQQWTRGRTRHQPGHLPGHPRRAAVQVQR